jgi:dihydrolipoamide dehydrogenase
MFTAEKRAVDYRAMPRCVFTVPEVASIGLTEREARDRGIGVRTALTGIDENDRALTSDQREGIVKVVADESGRLLGGAVVAPRAGEVIHELGLAINLGATAEQVASLVHAFPTYSEVIGAACAQI